MLPRSWGERRSRSPCWMSLATFFGFDFLFVDGEKVLQMCTSDKWPVKPYGVGGAFVVAGKALYFAGPQWRCDSIADVVFPCHNLVLLNFRSPMRR